MRKVIGFLLGVGVIISSPLLVAAQDRVDVTGDWELTIETDGITMSKDLVLQQEGAQLTGTNAGVKIEGTVKDKAIEWKEPAKGKPKDIDVVYKGKVTGVDTMEGSVDFGPVGTAAWKAKRVKKDKIPNKSIEGDKK